MNGISTSLIDVDARVSTAKSKQFDFIYGLAALFLSVDWEEDITGGTISFRDDVDAWMEAVTEYYFAEVTVSKEMEAFGYPLVMEAKARAEVIPGSGRVWPDPLPEFDARLTMTN